MIRARIVPYALPFVRPVRLGREVLYERSGWLLALTDSGGRTGWGEASPLPEFSSETPAQAHRDLQRVAAAVERGDLHPSATDCSSARFALELAVANLRAAQQSLPLAQVWNAAARPSQSVNAALLADEPGAEADSAIRAGFRALKIKVGSVSLHRDAARVRRAAEAAEGRACLRLDANRAWSFNEALAFMHMIRGVDLEYIEEPLEDPSRLEELAGRGIPVALDESVRDLAPDGVSKRRWATAIVIKPTIVGGVQQARRLAAEALKHGIRPVISSAIETGIGLRGLVALGAAIGKEDIPAGLDTSRFLKADVTDPRFVGSPHMPADVTPGYTVRLP